WAAFLVYANSNTGARGGRGARGGGAAGAAPPTMPTKLDVVSLIDGTKREFENVRAFRFAGDKSDWIAIHHAAPNAGAAANAAANAAGRGGAAGAPAPTTGTTLELVNLTGGTPIPIADVSEFAFDDRADWIAYAVSIADQLGNSIQLRQLSTGIVRSLD